MTEDYISFETAKLLKKKGLSMPFDSKEWICCMYDENGNVHWIIYDEYVYFIVNINDDKYELELINGTKWFPHINTVDKWFHLWTIQDAKDRDVLVDGDTPFIFKGLIDPHHPGQPVAYGGVDCENNFIVGSGSEDGTNWWCSYKRVKPATKKQRDLLFRKMKEAGYEWIDYEKELVCAKN